MTTLKTLGNQYYQFVPDFEEFKTKCRNTDTDGFNLLFQNEVESDINEDTSKEDEKLLENIDMSKSDDEEMDPKLADDEESDNDDEESDADDGDLEEEEYKKKDCVKKWQFEYNRSTCFSHNYPEINYKEDTSEEISVAPGEGKLPSNILEEKDWDLKSFPCLHPDGMNSLQSDRPIQLGDQD